MDAREMQGNEKNGSSAKPEEGDPRLRPVETTAFEDIIENDILAHPEKLKPFDGALYNHMKTLVSDIDVDLEKPLSSEEN
jgi:hypothetical protein